MARWPSAGGASYIGSILPILAAAVLHYLQEVLGIEVPRVKPWARSNELPYFLRDAFQISELV